MSQVFEYMEEVVLNAKQHTDSIISNVSKSLIPCFVNLEYKFIRDGKYRFDNETYRDEDHLILRVDGIRERYYTIHNKSESVYKMNVYSAIQAERLYPFMLFVNGKHVKWSDMVIVKDARYTYLLLPKNPFKDIESQIVKIKSVEYLHLPIKTKYTETKERVYDKGYQVFIRFDEEGYVSDVGNTIYYLNHPSLIIKEYNFTSGLVDKHDTGIEYTNKLELENFIVFKDRMLDRSTPIRIGRLNTLSLKGNEDSVYKVKCVYRVDINNPFNMINKFENKELAKDISVDKVTNTNMNKNILNKSFDFNIESNRTYDQNIKRSFKYISSVDGEFIKDVYVKSSNVETKVMNGKEVRDKINIFGVLSMLLSKFKEKDTRVLVFCNGLLYHRYSELTYQSTTFKIPIDIETLKDNDVFEFVFLKNINNYSELIVYTQENRFKENNPFEDDVLKLYTQNPKDHKFEEQTVLNERSWFEVPFVMDGNDVIIDEFYYNTPILYTAKNQFKYSYRYIRQESVKIKLSEDFMTSLNPSQYLVFINGRILNKEYYRLIIPSTENVFTDPYIYTRVKLNVGDKVEIIYGPIDFNAIDYSGNLTTKIVDIIIERDTEEYKIPYPFDLYSPSNSFMVFIDGTFVDPSRYIVDNNHIKFIDSTVLFKDTKITFTFLYDKSEEVEASIYLHNGTGLYMENLRLPIEEDGQTTFNIEDDKYIDWLLQGCGAIITYKGLYVSSQYWRLNQYSATISFAPNSFKQGEYINCILIRVPTEIEKIEAKLRVVDDWVEDLSEEDINSEVNEANKLALYKTEIMVDIENDKDVLSSSDIFGFPVKVVREMSVDDLISMNEDEIKSSIEDVVNERMNRMDTGLFDIKSYINNGNPIFIMQNGTLLTEGYHYVIDKDLVKIKFRNKLNKNDRLYLITYRSLNRQIKSYEYNILIEDVNVVEYNLYDRFGDLDNLKCRFMVYIGSIVVDPMRYTIDNYKLVFKDNSLMLKGAHIRILCLYVDKHPLLYSYNRTGSSRYVGIHTIGVPFEEGVYSYIIPYPNNEKCDFIVTCGSVLIDETRFIINDLNNTITFSETDDIFINHTQFEITFFGDGMNKINISSGSGSRIYPSPNKYSIDPPFDNYFEKNKIIVFGNGLYIPEDRYNIDKENNIIEIKGDYSIYDKLIYLFAYFNDVKNISHTNDNVTISTIQKNGYIFMNKDKLTHPLSKELVWVFMNGRKVPKSNLMDISSNLMRITKDLQSRYNLMILSHTPKIEMMDIFFKSYSNYDVLVNNLSTSELNQLFNTHMSVSDTEPHYQMNINKDALVTEIIRDWYGRTGIYNGNDFANTYNDISDGNDIQLDPSTGEYHSMVMDASGYFSVPLDRSNTNKDSIEQ